MGRFWTLFLIILLLFACKSKDNTSREEVEEKEEIHSFYKKSHFPVADLEADSGSLVLAPPSKFVDEFISIDENNFFVFYPRKLLGHDKNQALISEYDSVVSIPNILVIPFPRSERAKVGDYVLTWWQEGTGMQRAIVIEAENPYRPKVRYLDLEHSSARLQGGEGILDSGSFRVIRKPLDPGSSVMFYDTTGNYKYFLVIRHLGDKIIGLGWSGNIALLDTSSVKPNPVYEDYELGESVFAPLYGIYTKGVIRKIDRGLAKVEFDLLGNKIEEQIPLLDLHKVD